MSKQEITGDLKRLCCDKLKYFKKVLTSTIKGDKIILAIKEKRKRRTILCQLIWLKRAKLNASGM